MPTARHCIAAFTAICALALVVSCGKDGSAVRADTAPFEQAIAAYLDSHSMDMKVAEFVSLDVQGDAARAVCKMQVKSDLYAGGVGVKWTFTFEKAGAAWRVTDLQK